MRTLVTLLVLAALASLALARSGDDEVKGVQLTIQSSTLPEADRKEITRVFENETYENTREIQERLRDALQVLGYFKASVGDPSVSFIREGRGRVADIKVTVDEGSRYQLGQIRFRNGLAFTPAELRNTIPIQTGELFNVEKMRVGIRNLRDLYGTKGYVNFTPVPDTETDDERHIVDVVFDLDEGKPFSFGPLVLDGREPHAGAGKALLESWKTLQGKPYNPNELRQWFVQNQSNLPKNPEHLMEVSQDNASGIVIVRLWFP